jgi:adenylate kinase
MQTGDLGQTFVFFGIVGSGKGTQVKLLQNYLKERDGKECAYIGTGEIFRDIIASSDGSETANIAKELLGAGKLMPDEITNKLVKEKVESGLSADKHGIFDGYPRTLAQSEVFEKMMQEHARKHVKIIYIELTEAEAMKRNLLRGRHDDTEEGLRKRFDEYVNKVVPAMNYFRGKDGYTIYEINGEQSVEAVHQDIIKAINS